MGKRVSWSDILGNKYRIGLNPLMFTDKYVIEQKCRLVGEPKGKATTTHSVKYDREYLYCWFVHKIFFPLGIETQEDYEKLILPIVYRYLNSRDER